MQAILLTKDNKAKIVEAGAEIDEKDLDEMIEEYNEHSLGGELIFIPKFEEVPNQGPRPPYTGWASVPRDAFETYFTTEDDVEKMKTEFITVTHKPGT